MISWHRPGQKVAVIGSGWRLWLLPFVQVRGPAEGQVYTIRRVVRSLGRVAFELVEWPDRFMSARRFRPVYPEVIEELRKLGAPSPEHERVKEDEHA